jgi:hypothetical protein
VVVHQRGHDADWHWQYRGRKAGRGDWKWFDVDISRQLEEAFRAGRETVVLQDQWGRKEEYSVHNMIAIWPSSDPEKTVTRSIIRMQGKNQT